MRQASTSSDPGPWGLAVLFSALEQRYRSDVATQRVSGERRQALELLLEELRTLVHQPPDDPTGIMALLGKLRELQERLGPALASPNLATPPPPAASRAAALCDRVGRWKVFVARELARPMLGTAERAAATDLLVRLGRAFQALNVSGAGDTQALERELLRALGRDVREFGVRRHLTIAAPAWETPPRGSDASSVFYSGGESARDLVAGVCEHRGLTLTPRQGPAGRELGPARWRELWTSHAAVFDFGAAPGPALAAVSYELGLARALDHPCVILVPLEQRLPFDVNLEPYALTGRDDAALVERALDDALFGVPEPPAGDSLAATLAHAAATLDARRGQPALRGALDVARGAADDPVAVHRALETALGLAGKPDARLLLPAWPGSYADPRSPRCFHVMPFGYPWSDAVRDLAAAACVQAHVTYVRADLVRESRIIRSIWDEICRATHILVDLTAFNANVAFELGVAHALGRSVFLMGQSDTVERLFPSLAKVRVQRYDLADGGARLGHAIASFLDG